MSPSSTTCPSPSLLEAYASGAADAQGVVAHVARCPACAEYLEAARFSRRFAEVMTGSSPGVESESSEIPDIFGYRVLEEISRGGQGVIYRAEQITTGQRVAIKVLRLQGGALETSREARDRFVREIQIAASLNAPGIVRLLDSLKLMDGRDALVMELIDGVPLDAWSRREPAPSNRHKAELLAQIADALHHAHQRGVTHRDLKPSNILVDDQGGTHLLDFGVARWTGDSGARDRVTLTGQFTGTLAYAAPEQVSQHAGAPDIRTDIYALGVIGFELLSGRLPYAVDGSLESAVRNILTSDLPTRSSPGPSMDLWCVLSKATAKRPERRYQSASDLARDLRSAARGEAIDARRDSRWYVLRKTASRHRYAVGLAAALLIGLAGIASVLAIGNHRLERTLRENRLSQVRAHIAAGDRERAEALLWPELSRAVPVGSDPVHALREGSFEHRRLIWRFAELQAPGPCLRVLRLPGGADSRMITQPDGTLGVVTAGGLVHRVDPGLGTLSSSDRPVFEPGRYGNWLVPDGRLAIAVDPSAIRCVELSTGDVFAERQLDEAFHDLARLSITSGGAALTEQGGSLVVLRFPSLDVLLKRDGLLPGQQVWLSPDTSRVAYLDAEARLRMVDIGSGRDLLPIGEPVLAQVAVNCLPQVVVDERRSAVIVSHRDGIEIVDISDPEQSRPRTLVSGYMTRVSLDPAGRLLAGNAYGDSALRLWSPESWRELPGLSGHENGVQSVAFTGEGPRLATIDTAGVFRLWGLPDPSWRTPFGAPTGMTHQLAISRDGSTLFLIDASGTLAVFDDAGNPLPGPIDPIRGVLITIDPSGRWLAVADLSGTIHLARLERESIVVHKALSLGRDALISGLRFAPDTGRAPLLAATTERGGAYLIDPESAVVQTSRETGFSISEFQWAPKGDRIVLTTRDGRIAVLDPSTEAPPRVFDASPSQLRTLVLSPDGRAAYAVGDAGFLAHIDLSSGVVRRSARISEHSLFALAIDQPGDHLFVGSRNGSVAVIDARSLRELAAFDAGGAVMHLHCAPDGRSLFVSALDRPVERWDFDALARTLPDVRPPAP